MKSGGFHEIQWISCPYERPFFARNGNPMFPTFTNAAFSGFSGFDWIIHSQFLFPNLGFG